MAMAFEKKRQGSAGTGENDIYTALLIIATVFMLIAVICVAYQFGNYYGFEYLFRSASG